MGRKLEKEGNVLIFKMLEYSLRLSGSHSQKSGQDSEKTPYWEGKEEEASKPKVSNFIQVAADTQKKPKLINIYRLKTKAKTCHAYTLVCSYCNLSG